MKASAECPECKCECILSGDLTTRVNLEGLITPGNRTRLSFLDKKITGWNVAQEVERVGR